MLVDNSHTLYIINHSILFLITIHTVTYHTNTQSLQLSCLCLLFHNTLRYLIVSFTIVLSVLTQYPFIISYSSIPSFKSLISLSIFLFLLHIKGIQRMWAQWVQHFQRPRIYHYYSYYPYSCPDWAPRNRFA